MSLSWLKSEESWSVATLLIAGVLIGMFVGTLAYLISYGLTAALNMTSYIHDVGVGGSNKTYVSVGNYTFVVSEPKNPALKTIVDEVVLFLTSLLKIVSNPLTLALVIATTLIIVGLEMRVR